MTGRADEERLLRETADKGGISVVAFGVERILALSFSFVVTAGLGAAVYGYLSVLRRTRAVLDEVLTGLASGHSRTIPRYDRSGQQSVLFASLLLVIGFGGTLGTALTVFRRPIVARTLFEPRHVTLVVVFAAGLIAEQGGNPPLQGWEEADTGFRLMCSSRCAGFRMSLLSWLRIVSYTPRWPNWTLRRGRRRPALKQRDADHTAPTTTLGGATCVSPR